MINSQFFRRVLVLLSSTFCGFSLLAQVQVFDMEALPTSATPPNHVPYTASSGTHAHRRGPKTMMFVYVKPSDGNEPVQKSFAQLESELNDTSQFFYDESYRSTWFGPKVMHYGTENQVTVPRLVVVRIDLSGTVQDYRSSFNRLYSEVILGVRALGGDYAAGGPLDPAKFDRIQAHGDPKLITSSGLAFTNSQFSYSGNNLTGNVVWHELGHTWGVNHANYWKGANGIARNASGTHSEYGDGADIMGGSGSFNTMFKARLGFLDVTRGEVLQVSSSGTYRLFAHTNPESRLETTRVRSLNLPVTAFENYPNQFMYLGYRYKNVTPGIPLMETVGKYDAERIRDSWDTHAVQLHAGGTSSNGGTQNNGSHFIDTTPNSVGGDDKVDGAIKIGRTYSEGPNVNGTHMYGGVHITPIAKGSLSANGVTHHYMDVVIHYGEFPGNTPPSASFAQSNLSANVGAPVTLTVQAQDPNGDSLAYDWDFGDGGYSIENSHTLTHTWQHAGLYLVRCTVSDMKGGTTTAEVWVNVGSGGTPPPTAPSGLTASATSSSQINLAWNDNSSDESGFKIERKTGSGGSWSQIATVGAGVTTYANTGLSASTTYFYRVRASNSAGDSAFANEANATTHADGAGPQLVFEDEFSDNDRTVNPAWYSLSSSISQSGGVLSVGGNANGHRYLFSNFAGATLAVGDRLVFSFRMKMTLQAALNRDREVVFAVGNNRGTLVTSDGGEVANYNDDLGYMATLGLGSGFSAIARDAGTASFLGRTWNASDHTQLGANILSSTGMNPTSTFKDYTLTLERTASGLDLVFSDGTTSVAVSDNAVPSGDFYTFNMVSVGFYNRDAANSVDVDQIRVQHIVQNAGDPMSQWMAEHGLEEDEMVSLDGKMYRADTLFIMGVNPHGDGSDVLQANLVFSPEGDMKIRFNPRAEREYQIQITDNLMNPEWMPAGSFVRFASSGFWEVDLPEPLASTFYRILVRYPEAGE